MALEQVTLERGGGGGGGGGVPEAIFISRSRSMQSFFSRVASSTWGAEGVKGVKGVRGK